MKILRWFVLSLTFFASLVNNSLFAQSAADAQTFGYYNDVSTYGINQGGYGTSRIMGVGGGTTTLGGDISSVSGNPAGMGMYKRGDFSFTPQISVTNTKTDYRGESSRGSNGNLNIANLGLVFSNMKDPLELGKFRGYNFGFAINRVKDQNTSQNFNGYANSDVRLNGDGTVSWNNVSYIDAIRSRLGNSYTLYDAYNNGGLLDLQAQQAYNQYLLDTNNLQQLRSFLPASDMKQSGSFVTKGRTMSYDFSAGINVDNKLFIGGGLSILSHNYSTTNTITEQFANIQLVGFQNDPLNKSYEKSSYTLVNSYSSSGTGINGRLGLIYLPTNELRLGLSYTSKTYNSITQSYTSDLTANYNGASYLGSTLSNQRTSSINLSNEYTYEVITPAKVSLGVSYFFSGMGFLTLDADYLDFTSATVQDTSNSSLSADNNFISKAYNSSVINVRLGGELKLGTSSLRAGFGFYQNPYSDKYLNYKDGGYSVNPYTGSGTMVASVGYGYRTDDFYFDMTLVSRGTEQGFISHLYTPLAKSKIYTTSLTFTIGFPFN